MLDWFECLNGSGCYSAKAGGYMAHIQRYSDHKWLWNWNKHTHLADTLEDAKREVEHVVKQAG
jgi:hypothetical protein